MTDMHDKIIEIGRAAFNFSPEEEFEGVEQLLRLARKRWMSKHYNFAAASFLESIAHIIDKNNDTN